VINDAICGDSMDISDSTISAYVRNELDDYELHAVEAVMAAEPRVARQAVFELWVRVHP
jgi:anti-sigma factor RsiW